MGHSLKQVVWSVGYYIGAERLAISKNITDSFSIKDSLKTTVFFVIMKGDKTTGRKLKATRISKIKKNPEDKIELFLKVSDY